MQYAPITKRVIDGLEKCRVISRYGIGTDMIDIEAAGKKDIPVMNVPDYCVEEVSDHAVALMPAGLRKIVLHHTRVLGGVWDAVSAGAVYRMRDRTVGFAGFGNIPRMTAEKLSGFGCPLIAHDPFCGAEIFSSRGGVSMNPPSMRR